MNGEGKNTYWTRIGSAWAHGNTQGFNIELSAVPVNGRTVLTIPKEKTKDETTEQ